MENWKWKQISWRTRKKGKRVLTLWKSITEQSSRPCFPNTDYKPGSKTDGAAVGTLSLWASAGRLIQSILALPCWRFHLSEVRGCGRGNGYLAPSPGNKETPTDEKVVEYLGEKNRAHNLRVNDSAGKGKRKYALIQHLLYAAYVTGVTIRNSHNNPRRWI